MKCIVCNTELSTGDINSVCLKCERKQEILQHKMPELVTENYESHWTAYLKDIPGMVTQGESEEEAINELMISIKVKLLYDKDKI